MKRKPEGCHFCDVIIAREVSCSTGCPRWDCRRERVPIARDERVATERLADLLQNIERQAAALRALGGSITFSLVFGVTVRNGRGSTSFYSTDLQDALAEAALDIAALRGRGALPDLP